MGRRMMLAVVVAVIGGVLTGETKLPSTFGPMDLKHKVKGVTFIQENIWQPGASTGWHTHPGFSLVTVTAGTVTVYDGDDPNCEPQQYGVGKTFIDPASNGVPHLIRNEGTEVAKTTAVQLVPYQLRSSRRTNSDQPQQCGVL